MAHMGPGRRLKTSSQSSGYLGGVGCWVKNWFWKGKIEAYLPNDRNKSIIWDKQKQKCGDWNNPEEKSKPPPPPPSGLISMPQMSSPAGPGAPSSSGHPFNIFSGKAGAQYKYVDVLNPSKPANSGLTPNPADSFVHVAPMSMPAKLFVPCSGACQQLPDDQQPLEGSEGGNPEQNSPNGTIAPRMFNLPPAPKVPAVSDCSKSGEIRQSGYVNLWRSLYHATTKIMALGTLTATMCRSHV